MKFNKNKLSILIQAESAVSELQREMEKIISASMYDTNGDSETTKLLINIINNKLGDALDNVSTTIKKQLDISSSQADQFAEGFKGAMKRNFKSIIKDFIASKAFKKAMNRIEPLDQEEVDEVLEKIKKSYGLSDTFLKRSDLEHMGFS